MDDGDLFTRYPRRLVRRLLATYHGFNEHDGLLMAAAVAYYFALSFFPLLLVLVAGLGLALNDGDRPGCPGAIARGAGAAGLARAERSSGPALAVVSEKATSRGPIGFVALLVTAVAIFSQVDHAFNRIWRIPDDGQGLARWLAAGVSQAQVAVDAVGAGAFVLAATISSLVWSAVKRDRAGRAGHSEFNWLVSLLINVRSIFSPLRSSTASYPA